MTGPRYKVATSYPLLRIEDVLDQLFEAMYFTKIDLRSKYHQIRLDQKSIEIITLNTCMAITRFLVLLFGLANAPGTFPALIKDTFRDYLDNFILFYLGNILIYWRTREEHIVHVRESVATLRKHKIYDKISRCTFEATQTEYLGFTTECL